VKIFGEPDPHARVRSIASSGTRLRSGASADLMYAGLLLAVRTVRGWLLISLFPPTNLPRLRDDPAGRDDFMHGPRRKRHGSPFWRNAVRRRKRQSTMRDGTEKG